MNENIVFVLDNKLQVAYVEQLSANLSINEVNFTNALDSNFIGFYDWLRVANNEINGVRLNPFDFAEEMIQRLPNRSYIRKLSDSAVEIYLTDNFSFIEQNSSDQDFGSCKIYKSETLGYAIGFNIDTLSLTEKQHLDTLIKETQDR